MGGVVSPENGRGSWVFSSVNPEMGLGRGSRRSLRTGGPLRTLRPRHVPSETRLTAPLCARQRLDEGRRQDLRKPRGHQLGATRPEDEVRARRWREPLDAPTLSPPPKLPQDQSTIGRRHTFHNEAGNLLDFTTIVQAVSRDLSQRKVAQDVFGGVVPVGNDPLTLWQRPRRLRIRTRGPGRTDRKRPRPR